MRERLTVNFRGRVQGVGFRFTTRAIARGFDVTGWVRNEHDGSVDLLVEGERGELEAFLDAIRDRMKRNIQDERVIWGKAEGDLSEFTIRRW